MVAVRFWLLLWFISTSVWGGTLTLDPSQRMYVLQDEIHYIEDADKTLSVEDLLAMPDESWTPNKREIFNQGYSDAVWWLKVSFVNASSMPLTRYLEVSYPVLDRLDIYLSEQGRQVEPKAPPESFLMGDKIPFYQRPMQHRFFIVPLTIKPQASLTVLVAVSSSSSVQVPMQVWEPTAFYQVDQSQNLIQGIYFGIMLVMILYNLFVFLAVGERNYLYYVLFVTSMLLFLASLNGYTFQYLWPEATQWNDQVLLVALSGVVFFGTVFTHRFLDLSLLNARLRVSSATLMSASVATVVASFFVSYSRMIHILIPIAAIACVYAFSTGAVRWRQGSQSAKFYSIAWTAMLAGGLILAMNKFQILPKTSFTEYATQIGSALEVILLSFALAERINQEKHMRFTAQQEALQSERALRQAREEALTAQSRAMEMLESKVQERTQELEVLNRKLAELSTTDALTGLKNRRLLDQSLQEALVRCTRYQQELSVILIDIDHFKRFNDTYGHLAGDACLRAVARKIDGDLRWPSDLAARYGGEEFCILLPETREDGARIVAERIRSTIEQMEIEIEGTWVKVTISLGVTTLLPTPELKMTDVLASADEALYSAKSQGRNRVVFMPL